MLDDIKWGSYSKDFISQMVEYSNKMVDETFASYRQLTERSYWLFAFHSSLFGYAALAILKKDHAPINYIIAIAAIIAICCLLGNLFPTSVTYAGAAPINMSGAAYEYYADNASEQLKQLNIAKVKGNQVAIDHNTLELRKRTKRFKHTITFTLGALGFIVLYVFISQILPL